MQIALRSLVVPAVLATLASTATLTACGKQADAPRIQLGDTGFTLHLPPAMQHALDAAAPGFRTVQASSFRSDVAQAAAQAAVSSGAMPAAFAAVGDFNHDGMPDAVVEGTTPDDSALHVIAILNGSAPAAAEVMRFPVYDADAVGVYVTTPPAGTAGAFEVVDYPDSTLLYRFTGNGFAGTNISR